MAGEGKRLGELLIEKKLISSFQLEQALIEQRTSKEFLGTLLIRKGLLTKDDLLKTLAEQMGITYIRLQPDKIDWAATKRFSQAAIVEHKTLPIAMDRASITVAVVNPLDVWGLESIEQQADGRIVRQVLITEEDFQTALRYLRQGSAKEGSS